MARPVSGKGSKQRPTDLNAYAANYAAIFRKPMNTPTLEERAAKLEQYAEIIRESLEIIEANAAERGKEP